MILQKLKGKSIQDISGYARDELLRKIATNDLLANMLYTILPIPHPKKWVFIMGCYNSGTSLLLKTLASHPDISSLDEGASFTKQLITPEELGWTRMWSQVVDKIRIQETQSPPDVTKLKQDWGLHLDRQKDIYIEKSIANSFRMKWLQQNFKDAHFIFIVRNGYAVAEGIQRKVRKRKGAIPDEYGDTYPIELCAEQWVVNNQIIEQDSSDISAFKRIFYEDFCSTPQPIIEELWEFMGLEPIADWSATDRTWKIHEKNLNIQNLNEASFSRLSADDIQRIEMTAADMLTFYNYPLRSQAEGKPEMVDELR